MTISSFIQAGKLGVVAMGFSIAMMPTSFLILLILKPILSEITFFSLFGVNVVFWLIAVVICFIKLRKVKQQLTIYFPFPTEFKIYLNLIFLLVLRKLLSKMKL